MLTIADGVRLTLLLVSGLAVCGWRKWFWCLFFGAMLAWGMHWLVVWSWPLSLQASLATIFVLPLLFLILNNNPRMLLGFTPLLGLPALLVSRYLLGNSWYFALSEGIVVMILGPAAVVRLLLLLGIIKPPEIVVPKFGGYYSPIDAPSPFRSDSPKASSSSSPISTRRY